MSPEAIEKTLKKERFKETSPGKSFRRIIYKQRPIARDEIAVNAASVVKTFSCKHCGGRFGKGQIASHTKYCPKNPANFPPEQNEAVHAVAAPSANGNGHYDTLEVISKVKGVAGSVGGMKNLKALVEALSE